MKLLGLDLGDRHVGVALLDSAVQVALPLPAISNNRFFFKKLKELVAGHEIDQIVVGLPLTLAGTDSPQTRKVRDLADKISSIVGLPVVLEDERFTSRQAGHMIQSLPHPTAHHLDSVAASLIVTAWYQRHNQ